MTGLDLIVYGAIAAAAAGPAQTGPLTIDQAVAIAESRAFAVQLQQSGLLRTNAVVRENAGLLGPQITGSASYSRAGQALYGNFNGVSTLFSPIDTTTAGVSITLPIDTSGVLNARLRSAEASRRSQRQNLRTALNDTRQGARSAFIEVLRARAAVDVQEQSLTNARAQAEQARLQLEQVQVAKIDVDRLNAAVAARETDLINARNALQLAIYQLNLVLARPIETPVDAVDVATLPEAPASAAVLDQEARSQRPEVLAYRELVEARAQLRVAAERAQVPNVNLSLTQSRNLGSVGFGGQTNTTALGVSVSFPIFDSGVIRARVGEARQDEEQAKINLASTELSVSQEVRAAVTNLQNARARLTNAVRQVELAQEVFRIAQVRQSAGAGTYVEVVDAETTLTSARNDYVSARYDILSAYAALQRAVGNDRIDTVPTSPTPAGAPK